MGHFNESKKRGGEKGKSKSGDFEKMEAVLSMQANMLNTVR